MLWGRMRDALKRRDAREWRGALRWTAGAAAALAGAVAVLRYGVRGRSSQLFGRSVYQGAPGGKRIALTFDDGPSEGTPALLHYLAEQGIRATFFQCGINVERHPELARAVSAAGHEIGNHTYSHPRLCPRWSRSPNLLWPGEIFRELARTQAILKHTHGRAPTLFRAPYGMRWFGLRAAQRRLRLLGVLWTVIGHDWEWSAEKIAAFVLGRIASGGIICLHDGRDIQPGVDLSAMLSALRLMVSALQRQGYRFQTVSELLLPE